MQNNKIYKGKDYIEIAHKMGKNIIYDDLLTNKKFIERLKEIYTLNISSEGRFILHLVSIFEFTKPKVTYKKLKEEMLNEAANNN